MTDDGKLTLWLGAFRYYCGRRTYAVSQFCDLLIAEWPSLPERTRKLVQNELDEDFARDDRMRPSNYAPLGDACDRAERERVRALWLGENG
jgi:hypothetical protein